MPDQPRVSVVMPVFDGAPWVARALESLFAQTLTAWELIIVDDGSRDGLAAALNPFIADPRVKFRRNADNRGLGAALNEGLDQARAPLIAYLPADDLYHAGHLESLVALLDANPGAALAHSGVRHRYNRMAEGRIEGRPLQLVQVMHRARPERFLTRAELTTDDLDRMLWTRLLGGAEPVQTGVVSCEWVAHAGQRSLTVRETDGGGVNPYRHRYGVKEPLIFHSTAGHFIDERTRYARFRDAKMPAKAKGLKILLVGELAYNSERVLALAERGHRLYGLWTDAPMWFNAVGPLPFGHVEELPHDRWREAIERIKPDIIYGLLNWQAVPFVHGVMKAGLGIPFVWHFKEGPFICMEKGSWRELVELYAECDGGIYSSAEMRDWFAAFLPPASVARPRLVLDGDLPRADWFSDVRTPLLSDEDGEVHTVVPGRPIGLHPENVAQLAEAGIHLHFYGEHTHGLWAGWIERTRGLAGRFFHLHGNIDQENWVAEFSRYDAGWLHFFESRNGGELRRADWDDLNIPARMGTLAAAGLPMLQRDNTGHLVATQTLARDHELGLFFKDIPSLAPLLKDRARMAALRESVWSQRSRFTFDWHADALVAFFREVIARK